MMTGRPQTGTTCEVAAAAGHPGAVIGARAG